MVPRRAQTPISFRSDRAAARLALLTRDGRSQAKVIEDALDVAPVPTTGDNREAAIRRLRDAFRQLGDRNPPVPSMAEFDATEYDENGNLR